ncbi:serine hydrolase domain-containing protein [Sphingomonas sp. SRS2]|uniref:serine hydrolase domain-containing protein n=1 Tax=Sphingomonas sp. SRS2 TaxID=133190 RepID=UPI0006184AA7|nr:serine hydrolase [Sphingomonas sp. SRS2]KKC26051.1 beta-lactamase [Sphingomonas sp. SRS2]
MRTGALIATVAMLVGSVVFAQGPALRMPAPAPVPVIAAPTPLSPPGSHALVAADVNAWLDGYTPYALHSGDIAGAVVTVVKDGQVIAARGYGYADVAKRTPVDPARTLFRPGSTSKLVTWTAVMQQVEAGKLDLDRDVNAYLDFKIPPRNGKPVTLRQIMTHTGGFEEVLKNIIVYDPKVQVPLEVYLKDWVPTRIFDAGTTPNYSNWATALAGYIVQRVSGMPFDDYVERRIFAPLDMRMSSFRQPLPKALQPHMSAGYDRASEPAKGFEFVGPAPAGSLSSTGLDMARFMIAHLDKGRGLLKPETAALMHNSPLDKIDPVSLIPPLNRMELGFFQTNINGRHVIAHLGDTNDFHTSMHLFMDENVGLYVSFNSAGRDAAAHVARIQLFHDFADRYFPSAIRDGRVDAKTAAEHARMMTGHWEVSRRSSTNFVNILNLVGQIEITVDAEGNLVVPSLKGPGGAVQNWVEIAPFVWRDRNWHDRLAAQVVDGKVVRWSFDLVAPFMVFDRVPVWRSAGWLMPALYASIGILLLTLLYWPVSWYVRRRHAQRSTSGQSFTAYRATRLASALVLGLLAGWTGFVSMLFGDKIGNAAPWLWLLQIGGWIILIGATGIAAWNAWLTWRDGRGWARKLWNTLVLLAVLIVFFAAWAYSLLALTVHY